MSEAITFIGSGHVGLVSGACFAELGNRVVCMDRDNGTIQRLRQGEMPIYEPGLAELVKANTDAGRLSFTSEMADAVRASDILFIAVGTPSLPGGDVDMSQVESAVAEIGRYIDSDKIIVMKSTVPVGTGERIEQFLRSRIDSGIRIDVVSNPEFLREGTAIADTFQMDRAVIGAEDPAAGERLCKLHEPFGAPVLLTDRASAEMIKYASNAFLATKISFINEIANVCEKVGADVGLVAQGMGLDCRIGPHFLKAGIGYGGTCFPKDTRAQIRIAENVDYDFQILRSVIEVNERQRVKFAQLVEQALGGELTGKRIAVMGLTFKPDTDDMRDAPSLDIIPRLQAKGASVSTFDPVIREQASVCFKGVEAYDEPYAVLDGADAMVIVTEWDTVKSLSLERVKRLLRRPVIVDGRNIYNPHVMRDMGFAYYSIGRPAVHPQVGV